MLDDESRGEWLGKQGLHCEHLPFWEQDLAGMVQDKQCELAVKEKALPDAAVLLLLKKDHPNLFREDEEN